MKTLQLIAILILISSYNCLSSAQTKTLDSIINSNTLKMSVQDGSFSGDGWNLILAGLESSQNIMIGEDHFSNEIPVFSKAVFDATKFDNFYIEIDPYSTEIIENSILNLSDGERKKFNEGYKDVFSFYALKPEYDLLEHIVKSGTNILGSDQIVMFSDQLVAQDLIKTTKSEQAKNIYAHIIEQSKVHLDSFSKNPQKYPMYMMTPEFSTQMEKLKTLDLSEKELEIVEALELSKTIYTKQSHKIRVQLIMNQVMKDLPLLQNKRTLYKYGANHLTRRESFLNNYDIGNLVMNITESNYQETFHIMIVGESGFLGSPFRAFPESPVDPENGFYLSYLKPFFNITNKIKDWYVFNLLPLRKALYKGDLNIENKNLERAIKGYDVLVIIPEVTAAKFD